MDVAGQGSKERRGFGVQEQCSGTEIGVDRVRRGDGGGQGEFLAVGGESYGGEQIACVGHVHAMVWPLQAYASQGGPAVGNLCQ